MASYGYSRRAPTTNASSIGGVSAVNPQAKTDFTGYVDQAYGALKSRLDPIFQQQQDTFQQQMTNRGIPVGGEAYNKSFQQLGQNQSDAYTQAANQAIGLGLSAQGQDFGQDATRSQLANALLQSKWGNELGWGNVGLGYAGLDERGRQFDNSLLEGARQFDTGLGEQARQFDSGLDYKYWGDQAQQDYMWDRAASDDYRWAAGQDRQDYYDQRSANQYDDMLFLSLLGVTPYQNPYTQDPTSAYNAQLGSWTGQYGANTAFWGDMIPKLFG